MTTKYVTKVAKLTAAEVKATTGFHKGKKNKIRFLGHLVYVHKLFSIKENVSGQLCTTNIAEGLGVSAATIGNYIRELKKLKWLHAVDEYFVVGKRSKSYTCTSYVLREIYTKRNQTVSAIKGLKKAKLIEKRRAAWKEHKVALHKLEKQVIESKEQEATVEQRQEAFVAYINIAKNYIGLPLDMARDIDIFLRDTVCNATHRKLFFQANKTLYATLGVKKTFTARTFQESNQYRRVNHLFTDVLHRPASARYRV